MALPPFRGKEGVRIANRHLTPPPRPEESRLRQYVAFSTHPSGEPSRHFRRDVLASCDVGRTPDREVEACSAQRRKSCARMDPFRVWDASMGSRMTVSA